MRTKRPIRGGLARLELLLVLAFVAFLIQLATLRLTELVWILDFRNWSRGVCIGLNVGAVLALIGIRFNRELRRMFVAALSPARHTHSSAGIAERGVGNDADYDARTQRDAEWRERARKRMPFT